MKKMVLGLVLALFCVQFFSCSKKNAELDFDAQLAKDIATIDTYLTAHNITAVQDSTGIRYVVTQIGTGIKPTLEGKISVRFTGTLLGGQIFLPQNSALLWMKDLIPGWRIALPKFNKGSKFTLYLPSGLAYGSGGGPSVPANANVVFEVELLDDDLQLIADVAAIDHYLDSIGATDIQNDPSGIRYTFVGAAGTGSIASSTSTVSVTYTGRFLKGNLVFATKSSPIYVRPVEIIEGWRIALQLIPAGSNVILYVPSVLAYGVGGTLDGVIPANANLIFEIHVISVN